MTFNRTLLVVSIVIVSVLVEQIGFTTADDLSCHTRYKRCFFDTHMAGTYEGENDTLDADKANQNNNDTSTISGLQTCLIKYQKCMQDALQFPSSEIETENSGADDLHPGRKKNSTLILRDKIDKHNSSATEQDSNGKQDSPGSDSESLLGFLEIPTTEQPHSTSEESIPVNYGFCKTELICLGTGIVAGIIICVILFLSLLVIYKNRRPQRRASRQNTNTPDSELGLSNIRIDQETQTPNNEPGYNQNGIPEPDVGDRPN